MDQLQDWAQIGGGLVLLFVCAEVLVRGAVVLAFRLGLSSLIIGLTVVAAGTSAPEFITCLSAAFGGAPDIAVGNIVGSNLANLLLIAGVAAVLRPLASLPRMLWRDGATMVGGTAVFVAIALSGELPRWSGLVLLAGFMAYLSWSYRVERRLPADVSVVARGTAEIGRLPSRLWLAVVLIVCGIGGVMLGAELLIRGGIGVARTAGVSEAVIGLTLFAVGTSLPELATVGVASWRGQDEIALGNVLGSCIFNILAIAGAVAAIQPLPVAGEMRSIDLWLLLAVTLLFPLFMATGRRIGRGEGGLLLAVYALYVGLRVALPLTQTA